MFGAIMAKKIVRSLFDAISRHDMDGILDCLDDDATLAFPGPGGPSIKESFPVYKVEGKEAIKDWFDSFNREWEISSYVIQNICAERHCLFAFGANTVLVEYELKIVTMRGAEESDVSGMASFSIKKGMITEIRYYECLKDPVWQKMAPRFQRRNGIGNKESAFPPLPQNEEFDEVVGVEEMEPLPLVE